LGPFRLSARLAETPAGIVFWGEDEQGRQATVAVLRQGAAADPAARERFRAAILAALPRRDVDGEAGEAAGGGGPRVLAAQPEGPAPWVAVAYEPDGEGGRPVGAERFLEPVALAGGRRRRRGPLFLPYWAGGGGPAVQAPAPAVGLRPGGAGERRLAAAVLALAAMLLVLAVLMLLLFACRPRVEAPPPDPPSDSPSQSQRSPSQQPSPTPSRRSPGPSPTPSPSSPSPGAPGDPGDPGDGGDL